jgi:hypothetical protein
VSVPFYLDASSEPWAFVVTDLGDWEKWVVKALDLIMVAAVGLALLFGGYEDTKTLYFPALALLWFGLFNLRRLVHPYVLVLLTLLATLILSAPYGIFGIGLIYLVLSAFVLFVFIAAIAIPFGITAVSAYVRRVRRGKA